MTSWNALAPLLPLAMATLFLLLFGHLVKGGGRPLAFLGALACLASAALLLFVASRRGEASGGLLRYDALSAGLGVPILAAAVAALLLAPSYLARRGLDAGDFTSLVLMATLGLMLLVMARELLTAILALETASICLYALTGYDRHRESSAEAALKYFLPGAVASALLLYGAACVFGATGSTRLEVHPGLATPLGMLGAGLLLSGLAYKAGLVPFHGWLPDAYAGAPAPATAYMAAAVKAGAFGVLARLVILALPGSTPVQASLALLAVVTMTFGNLAGLAQTGLKRLLAYSAIAHSGYLMVGVAAAARRGSTGPLVSYLLAYGLLTIGAFAAAGALEDPATGGLELAQLRGLWKRRPLLSLGLTFCLLGLAGFPPTIGFLAKVSLFGEAYARGLTGLVVVAVLNSVVALGYYLKPIVAMFMQDAPEGAEMPGTESAGGAGVLVFACGVGGLLLGIVPAIWM